MEASVLGSITIIRNKLILQTSLGENQLESPSPSHIEEEAAQHEHKRWSDRIQSPNILEISSVKQGKAEVKRAKRV